MALDGGPLGLAAKIAMAYKGRRDDDPEDPENEEGNPAGQTMGERYPNGEGWTRPGAADGTGARGVGAPYGPPGMYWEDHGPAPAMEHLAYGTHDSEGNPILRFTPTGKEHLSYPGGNQARGQDDEVDDPEAQQPSSRWHW